jgi:hypothetical protein
MLKQLFKPFKISVILFITIWFCVPALSFSQVSPWTVEKLQKEISLTELQTTAVKEILEKDRAQEIKDREAFKSDAVRLIEAAHKRRETVNSLIDNQLDNVQKEKFKSLTVLSPFDRELFDLIEGLLPDDDQAFTIESILIERYNKIKEMAPPGFMGGDMPPPGMGRSRSFKSMRKSFDRHTNRAIRKILNPVQKERFKQLLEYRDKNRDKTLPFMTEER